jgi:diguanylate cyclase (GGDEF)-like protein
MTLIFRLFDYFLPTSLRNNPADMMRGYIIVGMIVTNILVSLMVLVILMYFLELEENTHIGVSLDLLCLMTYLIALLLLKWTESFVVCANFLLATIAVVMIVGIQITGGYMDSPILQLALQLPVTAFLLLGLRPGIFWLIVTAGICFACYLSAILGFGYVQLLQNQALIDAMYIALQFTLLIVVGGALIIYETINSQLTQKLNEERNRFEHKASHDDLTGIPNRFEFFRRLKTCIDEARDRNQKVGVVYIDLDGFKPINDLLGHHMGDEALKAVALRLKKILRLSDTTARLGGDEFALILPGIHVPHDIESIMPKVLESIKEPIRINGVDVVVKASCGVSVFPNHSEDHNALCRYADMAMYLAKEQHDAYLMFDESMKVQKVRKPAPGASPA